MKKLLFTLACLAGIAFAPQVPDLPVRMLSAEIVDIEGRSVVVDKKLYDFSQYMANKYLEPGKTYFVFKNERSVETMKSTTTEVGKLVHCGSFLQLTNLDQLNGKLGKFLSWIASQTSNNQSTNEGCTVCFENEGEGFSKDNFKYVVELVTSLVAGVDPEIKVIEEITAEDQGKIGFQYNAVVEPKQLTLRFY